MKREGCSRAVATDRVCLSPMLSETHRLKKREKEFARERGVGGIDLNSLPQHGPKPFPYQDMNSTPRGADADGFNTGSSGDANIEETADQLLQGIATQHRSNNPNRSRAQAGCD